MYINGNKKIMFNTKIDNCLESCGRFALVVLASYRAEAISKGASTSLDSKSNKICKLALREIESGFQDLEKLEKLYISDLQCNKSIDEDQKDEFMGEKQDSDDTEKVALEVEEGILDHDFIDVDASESIISDDDSDTLIIKDAEDEQSDSEEDKE